MNSDMGFSWKSAIAATLAAILAAGAANIVAAERFFIGIEDLPVMPGLEQVVGAGVSFDAPAGRIVEITARGAVSSRAVTEYYRSALPQLGWQPGGEGGFSREGERLQLSISASGRSLTVRFSLRPR